MTTDHKKFLIAHISDEGTFYWVAPGVWVDDPGCSPMMYADRQAAQSDADDVTDMKHLPSARGGVNVIADPLQDTRDAPTPHHDCTVRLTAGAAPYLRWDGYWVADRADAMKAHHLIAALVAQGLHAEDYGRTVILERVRDR